MKTLKKLKWKIKLLATNWYFEVQKITKAGIKINIDIK